MKQLVSNVSTFHLGDHGVPVDEGGHLAHGVSLLDVVLLLLLAAVLDQIHGAVLVLYALQRHHCKQIFYFFFHQSQIYSD